MNIEIPQLKISIKCESDGVNLLALLVGHSIPVAQSCGGDGVCGTCALSVKGEDVPEPTSHEERVKRQQRISEAQRVACLITVPKSSKTWVIESDYW